MNIISTATTFEELFANIRRKQFFDEIAYELLEENRFSNEKLDNLMEKLVNCSNDIVELEKGSEVYRARIYSVSEEDEGCFDLKNPPFLGYGPEKSMAPTSNKTKNGRCNPQYIQCLYMTESKDCGIYEIRPHIGTIVSVAKIRVKRNLKLFHFGDVNKVLDEPLLIERQKNSDVVEYLNSWFSKPVVNEKDYIVTQYISEKIKRSFDGIAYSSSIYSGEKNMNYAVFDVNSCEPISSELVRIDDINLKITNVSEC